jgi:hypothetical protein
LIPYLNREKKLGHGGVYLSSSNNGKFKNRIEVIHRQHDFIPKRSKKLLDTKNSFSKNSRIQNQFTNISSLSYTPTMNTVRKNIGKHLRLQ